jgi:hypothetical protein
MPSAISYHASRIDIGAVVVVFNCLSVYIYNMTRTKRIAVNVIRILSELFGLGWVERQFSKFDGPWYMTFGLSDKYI